MKICMIKTFFWKKKDKVSNSKIQSENHPSLLDSELLNQ